MSAQFQTPSTRAAVIIPSTGAAETDRAVRSVLAQTLPTRAIVVSDGAGHLPFAGEQIVLPDNTGADGWNGHRIYTHIAPLIDADFLFLLDQDNWFEPEHVASLVPLAETHGVAWSLRRCWDEEGGFCFGVDTKESIGSPRFVGYTLIDVSSWCFRRDRTPLIASLNTNHYYADRFMTAQIMKYLGEDTVAAAGSGMATSNYRVSPVDRSNAKLTREERYRFAEYICE
jgi:hypothetical protein